MRITVGSLLCFLIACGGGTGEAVVIGVEIGAPVVAGQPIEVRLSGAVGALDFESSDPLAILPAAGRLTVEFRSAGPQTLTVRSGNGEGRATVDVRPAAAAALAFVLSDPQPIGKSQPLVSDAEVRAVDAFGNTVPGFVSPVRIRATGAGITGLDGDDGDEIVSFTQGRAVLAGRLILEADPSLAEVRLIAESDDGLTGISALVSLRPAGPRLAPLADYRDRNQNRAVDAGDALTLTFDEPVDPTIADPSPYGTVAAGPDENQVTITLAAGVALPSVVSIEGAGSAQVHAFPADTGVRLDRGQHSEDVAIVDVNQDGILDLVFANSYESRYFLGAPDGFSAVRSGNVGQTVSGTCVSSGDFNGDGWPDLIIGAQSRGMVFLNARNGSFAMVQSFNCNALVTDVEVGDLDGDGDDDIVAATRGSNSAWFNDGAGVFTRSQTFDSYYTEDIALVDIDGDGDLDSIHANVVLVNMLEPDAPNRIWINDGAGRFSLKADFGPLDRTWAMAAGDVDNDGDIDIVTAERSANRVWLNDGAGNLTLLTELAFPQFTFGMELCDLDNDGDLDLVTTRRAYLNDGTGRMTHLNRLVPGVRRRAGIAAGDLDQDGDMDVVIAYSQAEDLGDGQPNVVFYGSGTD